MGKEGIFFFCDSFFFAIFQSLSILCNAYEAIIFDVPLDTRHFIVTVFK